MPVKNKKTKSTLEGINMGFAFGVGLALRLLIFIYAGRWVDGKLGTEPWFAFIGLLLAIGMSFYYFFTELLGNKAGGKTGESSEDDQNE